MTTNNTKKKTYNNYKNYGKWYSYKKIRNLLKTYFNAKLSINFGVVPDQGLYRFHIAGQNVGEAPLDSLVIITSYWDRYRQIFTSAKFKGVAVTVVPGQMITAVVLNNAIVPPYDGNIVIGLIEHPPQNMQYQQLCDANMYIMVSKTTTVRKYFPFFSSTFQTLPNNVQNVPSGLPFSLAVRNAPVPAPVNDDMMQRYNVQVDFYVSFRQSVIKYLTIVKKNFLIFKSPCFTALITALIFFLWRGCSFSKTYLE